MVIEVESEWNTAREFQEKQGPCLENGAISFWVVYPDLLVVRVADADGGRTYRDGDGIALRGVGEGTVAVRELLGPGETRPDLVYFALRLEYDRAQYLRGEGGTLGIGGSRAEGRGSYSGKGGQAGCADHGVSRHGADAKAGVYGG